MVALAFQVRAEQECAPQIQAFYRTWLKLAAKSGAKTQIVCSCVKQAFINAFLPVDLVSTA